MGGCVYTEKNIQGENRGWVYEELKLGEVAQNYLIMMNTKKKQKLINKKKTVASYIQII